MQWDLAFQEESLDSADNVNDWSEAHHRRLWTASDMVHKNLEISASKWKAEHDKKARQAPIRVGVRVYLRQPATRRNKIQDFNGKKVYKVINISDSIYQIKPADGFSKIKWVS